MAPKMEKKESEQAVGQTLLSSKVNFKDVEKGVPLQHVVLSHSYREARGHYAPLDGIKASQGGGEWCRRYLVCLLWLTFGVLCGLLALLASTTILQRHPSLSASDDFEAASQQEAAAPFDCDADYPNWETGWSSSKKAYCCKTMQRGCQNPDGPRYQCHVGEADRWPLSKQSWCCEHYQVGCFKYDCTAGQDSWVTSWSSEKKQFCCQHFDLGCPYECGADVSHAESAWSYDKKAWCCQERRMGCPADSCSTPCTLYGATTTCREHIQLASQDFWGRVSDEHACLNAQSLVHAQCSQCQGCSYQTANCTHQKAVVAGDQQPHKKDVSTVKKASSLKRSEVRTRERHQVADAKGPNHKDSREPAASSPYEWHDCASGEQSTWAAPKKAFCCKKEKKGCDAQVSNSTAAEAGRVSANSAGRHNSTNTTI